jgi:hypothetical protein
VPPATPLMSGVFRNVPPATPLLSGLAEEVEASVPLATWLISHPTHKWVLGRLRRVEEIVGSARLAEDVEACVGPLLTG